LASSNRLRTRQCFNSTTKANRFVHVLSVVFPLSVWEKPAICIDG
jgi:hypothetical protein